VFFTTGQNCYFKNSPGNRREEPTRGAISSGTLWFEATPLSQKLWSPAGPPPCASIRLARSISPLSPPAKLT